jgi:hypothetical protein
MALIKEDVARSSDASTNQALPEPDYAAEADQSHLKLRGDELLRNSSRLRPHRSNMASRPKFIRNKTVMVIVGVAAASLAGYVMWGPIPGAAVAVLATVGGLFSAWRHNVRDARVRTRADNFSFAEVAVRMRAKDRAHELMLAKRATAVLEPAATGSG